MSAYPPDGRVWIAPFQRQAEGEEVTIGLPSTGAFVVLPKDAVELLDLLAEGKTVREAEVDYEARYGQRPDLVELLEVLEARGLVRPLEAAQETRPTEQRDSVRYHFAGFPQSLARKLFGPVALTLYGGLVVLAGVALVVQPGLVPPLRSIVPTQHLSAAALMLLGLNLFTLFVHEFAHLVAARAVGVGSRMGLGRRMWFIVAETDLSGLWSLPRRQRYIPLLAGPISDMVVAALTVLCMYVHSRGWLPLPATLTYFCLALFYLCLFRVLWQCYFFLRTDFYYVFTTFFSCKSLMKDTEAWLSHLLGRVLRRGRGVRSPLEDLPARERPFIYAYSVLWLLGRVVSLVLLFSLQLPFLGHFLLNAWRTLVDPATSAYGRVDVLLVTSLSAGSLLVGLVLWLRGLVRNRLLTRPLQPAGLASSPTPER